MCTDSSVSDRFQMRLLLPVHAVPYLPSRRIHPGIVVAQFSTFTAVQRHREGWPGLSALHNAHGTKGLKPGLHIKPPLLTCDVAMERQSEDGGVLMRDGEEIDKRMHKMAREQKCVKQSEGAAGGHPGKASERLDWQQIYTPLSSSVKSKDFRARHSAICTVHVTPSHSAQRALKESTKRKRINKAKKKNCCVSWKLGV
ncbi:hypothetical protein L227DRAFT_568598 [Lentinus tigrinus ALCF2SS1-6]|uniref:Uncharacterized protein n=1 Tax=Lentinus tigrinus ALCF2SS1-6 TaxID=1328759 RepID=A0A5C2RMK9_9APHY|nr:hypothetical protein L227DRAFT_568598 [Lentinus tigrinus ALCF2SS1-6]